MIKKTQSQIVYELFLEGGEYTSQSIHVKTKIPLDNISIYLNDLKAKDKIKKIDKIGRWNLYTLVPREERNKPKNQISKEAIEHLKFLNDFFKKNYKLLASRKSNVDYIIENEETFDKIEEEIKNVELT